MAPAGADDERVVDLGNALARAGLAALVYWSPEKVAKRIHPPDIQNLVAAFQYLRDQPFVDPDRVGFAGFCVGASFVLMAAAQEDIRDDVAFVNASGPYYDLQDLARAIGTGTRSSNGQLISWTPDKLTKEVTTLLLVESLDLTAERDQVRQAFASGREPGPGELSREAAAVYRILAGGTSEQVESAVVALPAELLAKMEVVSPATYADQIEAPVLLMHDRDDELVPSDESRRLAEALADNPGLRYTEFSLFQHVTPSRPLGLWELARELNKLFWHMYAIMRQTT